MTLNAKIGGFMDFFRDFSCASLYHSQGGATVLALVAWHSWQRIPAETKLLYTGPG